MGSKALLQQQVDSLREAIDLASEMVPKLSAVPPPAEGVSLLHVKNELALSYLENMMFVVLLKLRNAASDTDSKSQLDLENSKLGKASAKKLLELRLSLEKGVRPLEDKLQYQIQKSTRAAADAERAEQQEEKAQNKEDDDSESEEDSDDDDEDGGANVDDSDAEEDQVPMSNRPRTTDNDDGETTRSGKPTGVYKPPKRLSALMPSTDRATATTTERRERTDKRPLKSAIMEEFVADEYSATPMAQPSIGTNIGDRGRHMKTDRERQREEERREYEERNYVRLPKEAKKEKSRQAGRNGPMAFGGEEWRDIGEGVDRINTLTKRKKSGGSVRTLLEKSRKRGRDTVDGPRGSGTSAISIGGDRSQKRMKNRR